MSFTGRLQPKGHGASGDAYVHRASGGRVAHAVIYSLIASCRRRGINPQEYLTEVLGRLPGIDITQIDQLLPEYWKKPAPVPG